MDKSLYPELERERAYARECTEAGRECLPPREAARLFGVDSSTIRAAKSAGHVAPVFELTAGGGPAVPFYRLGDLVEHFTRTGRAKADPALLAKMRENGHTCFMQSVAPGGWLLLSERPGLRAWEEAAS